MKYFLIVLSVVFISALSSAQESERVLVEWRTIEQADSLQLSGDKRQIFVDVYADWCYPCKLMDQNTFTDDKVATYLNENFIPVKLNAESKESITFKGVKYNWIDTGRNGIHSLAYVLLGGEIRYPSMPFLNSEGKTLTIINGYITAPQFLEIITEVKKQIDVYYSENQN